MKNINNKNLIIFGLLAIFVFSTALALPMKASAHVFGEDGQNIWTDNSVAPYQQPEPVAPTPSPIVVPTPVVIQTPIISSITPSSTGTVENSANYSGHWKFSTNTNTDLNNGNPGNGKLRFDSTTQTNTTEITISDTDADTNAMGSYLNSLSNSNNYGLIKISSQDDSTFWYGEITVVRDQGNFHWLKVTYVESAGTPFISGENIELSFQPSGNIGAVQVNNTTIHKCSETKNITIVGKNFISSSIAKWDGSPRATTFLNSTRLIMQPTSTDVCDTGNHLITVDNGQYNGGVSNGVYFTVNKEKTSLNLGANALFAGFMPSSLLEWLLLLGLILLIIFLVRRMLYKKEEKDKPLKHA